MITFSDLRLAFVISFNWSISRLRSGKNRKYAIQGVFVPNLKFSNFIFVTYLIASTKSLMDIPLKSDKIISFFFRSLKWEMQTKKLMKNTKMRRKKADNLLVSYWQKFGGQNFSADNFFRQQAIFSALLSAEILSDKVSLLKWT